MRQGKVFRLSGCLVAIGFTLLIPAFFGLLVALLFTVAIIGGTGNFISIGKEQARTNAVAQMKAIDGVPDSFVRLFETNQSLAMTEATNLSSDIQLPAMHVIDIFYQDTSRAETAGGLTATAGGIAVLIAYVVSIPTLIVGFLLVLRKKVWRCTQCGYIFDRA